MRTIFAAAGWCLLLGQTLLLSQDAAPSDNIFVSAVLKPFWDIQPMSESLFFIQSDDATRPRASLLFQPQEILAVTSATRETAYEAGRDYVLDTSADTDTATLVLPEGSRIPFKSIDELYPLMTSDAPKIERQQGDTTRGIYFDNAAGYHRRQVEITYRCEPGQWQGDVPEFAGDAMPHTMKKLRAGEPLSVRLCGDSISAGYNASKFTDAAPRCPAYGELIALALASHYGSDVQFTNDAVGGWNAARGLQQVFDDEVGQQKPDLVMIAFGMNDVFARDAAAYQKNIEGIIGAVGADSPNTEFILVASMLGNAEWGMPMEQFGLHRDALQRLCGEGVVLADLTAVWEELLRHKSFYDLTGNGANHPNDFGHRIYAQVILALLIDDKDRAAPEE